MPASTCPLADQCKFVSSDLDGEPSKHSPKRWIYRNLTPWRIHACFDDDRTLVTPCRGDRIPCPKNAGKVLAIPALGETVVPAEDARVLDTLTMRRLGQIDLRPAPSVFLTILPRAVVIYGWLAIALVVAMRALLAGGSNAVPWRSCIAAAVAVPVAALLISTWREIRLYRRFGKYRDDLDRASGGDSLEGVERGGGIRTFVDGAPRQLAQVAVLVCAIVITVAGLGIAIHLTRQLNDLMPIDYGAFVQLDNPFAGLDEIARSSPAFWQMLVGHVAQWVLVSVAAIVPAAMYFQFDRQRLSAVHQRWIQEVFRLDPTVRTVRDIEAKYRSQIDTSFGDLDPDSGLRLGQGRRSPVIVATILLVVGWFLVISTTQVPQLVLAPVDGGDTQWVWPGGTFPVAAFFRPELSLVGYAFLGAYVFTLFHVIRGYQRRDLHPKTYNTIVARILTAYALALVVSVAYDGPLAEVVMFFVGFMPQSALIWMREKLTQNEGPWKAMPLHEPAPLTELEGIDLYDRTRLAEEGVNNVAALAHADIIDLMSSTRISAAELIDWADQALLYLKVGGDALTHQPQTAKADGAKPTPALDVHINLCHLRRFGIRTATDLTQAYQEALRRGNGDKTARHEEVRRLRSALALPSGPEDASVPPIQVIIDTLVDEEWFVQIRNWRNSEFGAADAWYRHLDGQDWELQLAEPPERIKLATKPLPAVPVVDEVVATQTQNARSAVSSKPTVMSANGGRRPRPDDCCCASVDSASSVGAVAREAADMAVKDPVNLDRALASFDDVYSPRIVSRVNDYDVRVAHVAGEHVWHVHDDTDEFFLVLDGRFDVAWRDAEGVERTVVLERGDTFVVPRGTEHKPSSPGGSILMFEPTGTSTTGDRHDGDIPDHVDSTIGHQL